MAAGPGEAGGWSGNRGQETREGAADGEEADVVAEALPIEVQQVASVVADPGAAAAVEDDRPFLPRCRTSTKRPAEGLAQRQRSVSPRVAGAGSEAGGASSRSDSVAAPVRREVAETAVLGDLLVVPVGRVYRQREVTGVPPGGGPEMDGTWPRTCQFLIAGEECGEPGNEFLPVDVWAGGSRQQGMCWCEIHALVIAQTLLDAPLERSPMRPFVEGMMERLRLGVAREQLIAGLRATLQERDLEQRLQLLEVLFAGEQAERMVHGAEVQAAQRTADMGAMTGTMAALRVALLEEAEAEEGAAERLLRVRWQQEATEARARAFVAERDVYERQAAEAEMLGRRVQERLLAEEGAIRDRAAEWEARLRRTEQDAAFAAARREVRAQEAEMERRLRAKELEMERMAKDNLDERSTSELRVIKPGPSWRSGGRERKPRTRVNW